MRDDSVTTVGAARDHQHVPRTDAIQEHPRCPSCQRKHLTPGRVFDGHEGMLSLWCIRTQRNILPHACLTATGTGETTTTRETRQDIIPQMPPVQIELPQYRMEEVWVVSTSNDKTIVELARQQDGRGAATTNPSVQCYPKYPIGPLVLVGVSNVCVSIARIFIQNSNR